MFLSQRGKLRKEQKISFVIIERCSSVCKHGDEGLEDREEDAEEGRKEGERENMQAREGG